MRLEQLYPDFSSLPSEAQTADLSAYRLRRAQDLNKPPAEKKPTTGKRSQYDLSLTDEDKALMKMLGIKPKDLLALRAATAEPEVEENESDDTDLLKEDTFDEGDEE
jgi:hypothetical protein